MIDAATLTGLLDATWPAVSRREIDGWTIREGGGGGSRVSAATLAVPGSDADIAKAEAAMRDLGQPPLFMVREGEDALDATLAAAGYRVKDPTVGYAAPTASVIRPIPRLAVAPSWPPLAIQREIWAAGGIGPSRLAIMERAASPKTTLLGRHDDTPAGTVFVARHGEVAMLHALEVALPHRRCGLGYALVSGVGRWADAHDATRLAVLATRANRAATALYASMGFARATAYHYRIHPDAP
ncbi:Putative acetyl transferase [Oceanicola granulosus HTCC2516]|uniref:Putative acetyl transferase n=1 Tax=Oceanicola granulosus (strain ATCC BAA-861 / DSM 15982 / KCTC 12143 / HTCC2516) TaxID=314256 RepID=Q2CD41_OCEGH|nr:GNAT family N-acetyltransferase [Oceanicola granulosus]EAR50637.1 Putative acetyl transferase [Oceanicola granulosus HTCC2516]